MSFLDSNVMYIIGGIIIGLIAIFFIFIKLKDKKSGKKTGTRPPKNAAKNAKGNTNKEKKLLDGSVKKSIPYIHTYEDGIIETSEDVFTKSYHISDINFKIATDDEQTDIFLAYGRLLNSFTADTKFQVVIHNKSADPLTTMNSIRFDPQSDGLNDYRFEMNNMLIDKMKDGRNNITQEKYLVVEVKADGIQQAKQRFREIDKNIEKKFKDISRDHPSKVMNLTERLHVLHDIYNPRGETLFYNAKDKNGVPAFDLTLLMRSGLTTKDVIGPAGMDFSSPSYFMIGDNYGRTLYLENIPNWLNTEFLADIADIMCNMLISIYHSPIEKSKALKIVHNTMMDIDGQIADKQKRALESGYSTDLIPAALLRQQKYAKDLIDDITARDQNMFYVTITLTVFASNLEQLDELTRMVSDAAGNHMCSIKTLFFQQELGLNSTLPLCLNELHVSNMFTTESSAIFIPYTTQELHQKRGLYYGLNDTSKNMILFNRLYGENYNGLILGEPGNGKSFSAKMEMVSVLLRQPDSVVYVLDPQAEYVPLAEALNGEVIDLSPSSSSHLNPLDMDIGYGSEADPVGMKTEFIISMIEIMKGHGQSLDSAEKSIISRCVQNIYRPYLNALDNEIRAGNNITYDRHSVPTLTRLYREIQQQSDPAASSIAATMEMYVTGTLGTFSYRSNVDTSKRFVVYNIKNLGSGTKDLGLHVCLNDVWNKMIENSKKGIYTWIYIDEFYLLLQSESSAKFISNIWKMARKFNGVPTGILQNTEDLLKTADTRAIINNSSFIQLLSLRKMDRNAIAELLSLSESQLSHITDAGAGHGLLYAGKTVLPFSNDFPTDTKLYKLMSTSATKDEKITPIYREN